MADQINPYAAPSTIETAADTAQLAGSPMESLRGVAAGLTVICISLVVFGAWQLLLAASFINSYFWLIGLARLPDSLQNAMPLAVDLLILVALICCASIPAESRARGWISASVVSNAMTIIFFLPWIVGRQFEGMEKVWWLSSVLPIFSTATFFLFLRRLAHFMERPNFAKRAVHLLILYGIWEAMRYGMPHVEVWLLPWAIMPRGIAPWMYRLVFLTNACEHVLIFVVIVKYFNLARAMRSMIRGR